MLVAELHHSWTDSAEVMTWHGREEAIINSGKGLSHTTSLQVRSMVGEVICVMITRYIPMCM